MPKDRIRHSNIELRCARRRTKVVEEKGENNSNIELQCPRRSTYEIEEKGENNKLVTESFKLALLRSLSLA